MAPITKHTHSTVVYRQRWNALALAVLAVAVVAVFSQFVPMLGSGGSIVVLGPTGDPGEAAVRASQKVALSDQSTASGATSLQHRGGTGRLETFGRANTAMPRRALSSSESDAPPITPHRLATLKRATETSPRVARTRRTAVQAVDVQHVEPELLTVTEPSVPVTAELQNIRVAGAPGRWTTMFDIDIWNHVDELQAVHIVVYARNDTVAPPRRWAWPWAGSIFEHTFSSTGQLTVDALQRNWSERPAKARGVQIELGPGAYRALKGSLPLHATSTHDDWDGQDIEAYGFRQFFVWVFDTEGKLLWEKRYETAPMRLE